MPLVQLNHAKICSRALSHRHTDTHITPHIPQLYYMGSDYLIAVQCY